MSKIETADLAMFQETILVKPYKLRYKKVKQKVLDDEKNANKDPNKDIMALKTVDEKVLYNIQTVEIASIDPSNRLGLEVGEIVVIDWRRVREFDLIKNTYLISIYDIYSKVIVTE